MTHCAHTSAGAEVGKLPLMALAASFSYLSHLVSLRHNEPPQTDMNWGDTGASIPTDCTFSLKRRPKECAKSIRV